ncbi:MAG: efflux RND transporter periplasmic adaptor subunit, partial [Bacteroidota bacterium]
MDRVLKKKKWSAQKLLLYIGLPLVVISLVAFMATTAGSSKLNVVKERLTITNVIYGPFQETIPINGEVLPIRTIFVDAIEGGQVEELYLEGGEMVKRGDLILKLKNANLELNYMNLETNLLEQLDQLRNTRITMEESALNLQEQLLLVEADVIAQKQAYDRAKALFKDS